MKVVQVESLSTDEKEHKYVSYNEENGNAYSAKQREQEQSEPATLVLHKKGTDQIWDDIIGQEVKWKDMATKEKAKRIIVNTTKIIGVFCCLYFFVCSLDLLSSSFRLISGKSTGAVMNNEYISNPVVGLMIGILVTVLVQSSSTSTSIIVSMVASGILSVHDAIPMIMGSNIGTSVTNTIVSLTQVGDREQFRRAFAGATVHDMFNWLTVLVLLPIEVVSGMLEKLTGTIVNSFSSGSGAEVELLTVITTPFTELIIQLDSRILECWGMGFLHNEDSMVKKFCAYTNQTLSSTIAPTSQRPPPPTSAPTASTTMLPDVCKEPENAGVPDSCNFLFYNTSLSDSTIGIILLLISLTVLCTSLILIVKLLNSMLKGSIARVIQTVINANIPYVPWLTGYIAIVIGAVLTFIVQSSSVFTSTLTPLIGIGMITVDRAYPLTLGSNLGTTTTALLAAMAAVGDKKDSIQIALVHSFFNIFGITIFYPVPFMRWPIPLAKGLGNITANYRWFAVLYLIVMFFLFPGSVFALSLGGTVVMWSVLGPFLIVLAFVVFINVLQSKCPKVLPNVLKNWKFLPEPLRSLKPYDKIFTALPCCSKCRVSPADSDQEAAVVVIQNQHQTTKMGIDNPAPVSD